MIKRRKPYNGKTFFDPGRMRHKMSIYELISAPDGYGGTTQLLKHIKTVWCGIAPMRNNSDYNLQRWGLVAGETEFATLVYLQFRTIANFDIQKKHVLILDGKSRYVIAGQADTDDPRTIQKVVVYKESDVITLLGGKLEFSGNVYQLVTNDQEELDGDV